MPIKQIVAIRRKPGLTQAEFSTYVRDVHGSLAAAKPLGIARYVQNHAFDGAYGSAHDAAYAGISHRDLVVELFFPDEAAMERTFGDEYSRTTVREDGKNFNDFPSATIALVEEFPLDVPHPGDGAVKVFAYLKAATGVERDAFAKAVREAHVAIVREHATVVVPLRASVLNVPLPASANAAHFGGAAMPTFDAIVMSRFEDEAAAHAYRPYHTALVASLGASLDASASFFTVAREAVIFDVDVDFDVDDAVAGVA